MKKVINICSENKGKIQTVDFNEVSDLNCYVLVAHTIKSLYILSLVGSGLYRFINIDNKGYHYNGSFSSSKRAIKAAINSNSNNEIFEFENMREVAEFIVNYSF